MEVVAVEVDFDVGVDIIDLSFEWVGIIQGSHVHRRTHIVASALHLEHELVQLFIYP